MLEVAVLMVGVVVEVVVVLPGAGGLVPDCRQFPLQVEAPAPGVETVEDLVGDDEAEAALLDVPGQPLLSLEAGGHQTPGQQDSVELADSESVDIQRRGRQGPGEQGLVHTGPEGSHCTVRTNTSKPLFTP